MSEERKYPVAPEVAEETVAKWEFDCKVDLSIGSRSKLARAVKFGLLNFDGEKFSYRLVEPITLKGDKRLEVVTIRKPDGRAVLDSKGARTLEDTQLLIGLLSPEITGIVDRLDLRDLNTLTEVVDFFDQ